MLIILLLKDSPRLALQDRDILLNDFGKPPWNLRLAHDLSKYSRRINQQLLKVSAFKSKLLFENFHKPYWGLTSTPSWHIDFGPHCAMSRVSPSPLVRPRINIHLFLIQSKFSWIQHYRTTRVELNSPLPNTNRLVGGAGGFVLQTTTGYSSLSLNGTRNATNNYFI